MRFRTAIQIGSGHIRSGALSVRSRFCTGLVAGAWSSSTILHGWASLPLPGRLPGRVLDTRAMPRCPDARGPSPVVACEPMRFVILTMSMPDLSNIYRTYVRFLAGYSILSRCQPPSLINQGVFFFFVGRLETRTGHKTATEATAEMPSAGAQ